MIQEARGGAKGWEVLENRYHQQKIMHIKFCMYIVLTYVMFRL